MSVVISPSAYCRDAMLASFYWLTFLRSQESKIEIFNIYGKCVLSVETIHELSLQKMDISALPPGVYFIRIGDKSPLKFVKI
jgi:hypothetical protein